MAIYFDMDGVLADFRAGAEAAGAAYVGPETSDKKADDAMWDVIRSTPHFYAGLPEIPAGVRLFRALQDAGEAPEVLTAIPKPCHGITDAGPDKILWNESHLGPGVKTHICMREEKAGYCKGPSDYLFDDQDRNLAEWAAAGGTAVKFTENGPEHMPPVLKLKLELSRQDAEPESMPCPAEPSMA